MAAIAAAERPQFVYQKMALALRRKHGGIFGGALFSWQSFCCCYFIAACYMVVLSLWMDGVKGAPTQDGLLFLLTIYPLFWLLFRPALRYGEWRDAPGAWLLCGGAWLGACIGVLAHAIAWTATGWLGMERLENELGVWLGRMGYGLQIGLCAALISQWNKAARTAAEAASVGQAERRLQKAGRFLLTIVAVAMIVRVAFLSVQTIGPHYVGLILFPLLVPIMLFLGLGATVLLARVMGRNLLCAVVPPMACLALASAIDLPLLKTPFFFVLTFPYFVVALPNAIAICLAFGASQFFLRQTNRSAKRWPMLAPVALDLLAGFLCAVVLLFLWMACEGIYDKMVVIDRMDSTFRWPMLAAEAGAAMSAYAPWSLAGSFMTLVLLSAFLPALLHVGVAILSVLAFYIGGKDLAVVMARPATAGRALALCGFGAKVALAFAVIVALIASALYFSPLDPVRLIYWFVPGEG